MCYTQTTGYCMHKQHICYTNTTHIKNRVTNKQHNILHINKSNPFTCKQQVCYPYKCICHTHKPYVVIHTVLHTNRVINTQANNRNTNHKLGNPCTDKQQSILHKQDVLCTNNRICQTARLLTPETGYVAGKQQV